jgi:LPS-assembly lipoprotein
MPSLDRRTWLGALIALPTLFNTACGFRLRGSVSIPYKVLAITGNPSRRTASRFGNDYLDWK